MYLFTPCMECCGHAEIVYAFQSIEKKVTKGRIKESPWRSRKIVLELPTKKTGHPYISDLIVKGESDSADCESICESVEAESLPPVTTVSRQDL